MNAYNEISDLFFLTFDRWQTIILAFILPIVLIIKMFTTNTVNKIRGFKYLAIGSTIFSINYFMIGTILSESKMSQLSNNALFVLISNLVLFGAVPIIIGAILVLFDKFIEIDKVK